MDANQEWAGSSTSVPTAAGWYHGPGDPENTERYWDGVKWTGQRREAMPFAVDGSPGSYGGPNSTILAGLGARCGGRLLDWMVWVAITAVFSVPVTLATFNASQDAALNETRLPLWASLVGMGANLLGLAAIVAYEVISNRSFGGTVGKMVAKTQIVALDGSSPGVDKHVLRLSPYIVLSLVGLPTLFMPQVLTTQLLSGLGGLAVFIVAGVGLTLIATDDNEQALWDKLAGTKVTRRTSR